jgi:hypothetical protein
VGGLDMAILLLLGMFAFALLHLRVQGNVHWAIRGLGQDWNGSWEAECPNCSLFLSCLQ